MGTAPRAGVSNEIGIESAVEKEVKLEGSLPRKVVGKQGPGPWGYCWSVET